MSPPDRLIAAQLHAALGQCLIGQRIIVLESTRSTNDFLRQMLTPELPEGIVVFAEAQTAGRGRHGRHWASASHQGLWFSLLLRPRLSLLESARLTTWAAQAVATVIRDETGLKSTIKPPNDVYLGPRKVAGVLVETVAKRGPEYDAIVGLGLNLNQALQDFPGELRARAGSLAMALGHPVDRSSFAIAILRELERTREAHLALQASAPMSASH